MADRYEVGLGGGPNEQYTREFDRAVVMGEHYWTAVLLWAVKPEIGGIVTLTEENVRSDLLIICARCETEFGPDVPSTCQGAPQ